MSEEWRYGEEGVAVMGGGVAGTNVTNNYKYLKWIVSHILVYIFTSI